MEVRLEQKWDGLALPTDRTAHIVASPPRIGKPIAETGFLCIPVNCRISKIDPWTYEGGSLETDTPPEIHT